MPEVRPSTVAEVLEHGRGLIEENWQESGRDGALNLDADCYRELEAAGRLRIVAAWDGNQMVGYSIALVGPHPHTGRLVCSCSSLFVVRRYRGTLHAELMVATEEQGRQAGASLIQWAAAPGSALEAVLLRKGYQVIETMFGRET